MTSLKYSVWNPAALLTVLVLGAPCGARAQTTAPAIESRPAAGWAWATTRLSADHVEVRGPARRIRATEDQTLYRPDWQLTGSFSVAAVFERPGFTVESAAAFLTR